MATKTINIKMSLPCDSLEEQYLFTFGKLSKPVCLLCNTTVEVCKKFNLERHFNKLHRYFNENYPPGSAIRTGFIKQKNIFVGKTVIFVKKVMNWNRCSSPYELSLLLARNKKSLIEVILMARNCWSRLCQFLQKAHMMQWRLTLPLHASRPWGK